MQQGVHKKMPKWLAWALAGAIVPGLVALYFWLKGSGWLDIFMNEAVLKEYLSGLGSWKYAAFFLLQTAQVVVSPIPGNITALAGGYVLGFWPALLISTLATVVGSAMAFGLARLFGRPLVVRLVGEDTVRKYVDSFTKQSTFLLAAMFLIPFFPDDALCMIAGLTAIRWVPFLLIVILARPPGLIMSTLVGSGAIVMPLWGWILIGVAAAGLMFVSFRHGERISEWIMKTLSPRSPG